jgi:hypothetical protein
MSLPSELNKSLTSMIQLQACEEQMPWTRNTHHCVRVFVTPRINLLPSEFDTRHNVISELLKLLNPVEYPLILFMGGEDPSSNIVINCT